MRKYVGPVSSRYVGILIQLGFVALVARTLTLSDAGQYFFYAGLVLGTYLVVGLGLPDGIVRFAPALRAGDSLAEANWIARYGLLAAMATAPPLALCVAGFAYAQSGELGFSLLVGIWWLSYAIVFISAQTVVATGHGTLGTSMFYSFANFALLLVAVPAMVLGVATSVESVIGFVALSSGLAAAVTLVIAVRAVKGPARRPDATTFRAAWAQGAMVAAGRVVQACLMWSPVWIAAIVIGSESAAELGVATRVIAAVGAVIAAIRFSIRPELAHLAALDRWPEIQRKGSSIAAFATLLAIGAIIGILAVGPWLLPLIFGEGYGATAPLVALLLIGTVGESFGGPVDEVLKMSGEAQAVVLFQFTATSFAFVIEALAGSVVGTQGVAVAYGLAFVLLYSAMIYRLFVRRRIVMLAGASLSGPARDCGSPNRRRTRSS